jgi:hypothetical protein
LVKAETTQTVSSITPNVIGVYRHRAAGDGSDPQASENQGLAPIPVTWPGTVVFLRLPTRLQVFHREIVDEMHVPRASGGGRLGFE